MKLHGLEFDEAHTSVLKRAVRTLWTALHSSNQHWIPVMHSWRLNERHYGALTGLSKDEAKEQLGAEMLLKYRRGFETSPLAMTPEHPCWTGNDRRYRDLGPLLPTGESLQQCTERILPYWIESVVPSVRAGRTVLVAAHNNVIRCLCKHLDGICDEDLAKFDIPTGAPLVYLLDPSTLAPLGPRDAIGFSGHFLEDAALDAAQQGAAQGQAAEHAPCRTMEDRAAAFSASSFSPTPAGAPAGAAPSGTGAPRAGSAAAAADAAIAAPQLDRELARRHRAEYDLEGLVRGLALADLVPAHVLAAEVRRLGLDADGVLALVARAAAARTAAVGAAAVGVAATGSGLAGGPAAQDQRPRLAN